MAWVVVGPDDRKLYLSSAKNEDAAYVEYLREYPRDAWERNDVVISEVSEDFDMESDDSDW